MTSFVFSLPTIHYRISVPVVLPYNGKTVLKHNNKTCGPHPPSDEWCGFLEESHQHGPASALGPPYVYTVEINSPVQDILQVIDTAVKTPIEPL
jgi:alpha-1,3(6)-mannosylglycoprotein beta-1,6-N-acetyl-glucosaminyltransferase